MIIPMLCVTIFVILVVWFLLPRVARLMIHTRSEERFSRNAETDLVCRLLLEKKKTHEHLGVGRRDRNGDLRGESGGKDGETGLRCYNRAADQQLEHGKI